MIKIILAQILSDRHLTQADLSRATGIRPSTICELYHNNCDFLKVEHLDRICTFLHCTPSDLLVFCPPDSNGGKDNEISKGIKSF